MDLDSIAAAEVVAARQTFAALSISLIQMDLHRQVWALATVATVKGRNSSNFAATVASRMDSTPKASTSSFCLL